MARFLAIDWDGPLVHLVAGSASKGGVRFEQARSWTEDQPLTSANAETLGQRLKARLGEFGLAPAPLMVAVGRDRFVLKEIKHPAVPAHEEPALVRFQAVKELTDAAEDVVIDYQPGAGTESTGERRALAVALRKDHLKAYQGLARGVGLKLLAVTPRAFGVLAGLAVAAPSAETAAVLAIGESGGEFIVSRGGRVAFARSVAGPALATDAALLGEIRRNLAVYAGQSPRHPVRALFVTEPAGPNRGIADRLRDTLAIPVTAFDPLAALEQPLAGPAGAFAGAAGLIHLAASREFPINFVQPREPKPPKDPNRRTYALAAALAAVLLLGAVGLAWAQVSARDQTLKNLRAEKSGLETQLATLKYDEVRGNALDNWLAGEVNALDEIYELTAKIGDINKLRITKLTIDPVPAASGAKRQYAGRIMLTGVMPDDSGPLAALRNELVKDGTYKVEHGSIDANRLGIERQSFRQSFTFRYDAEKRPPDKYIRQFTATPPERRRNRGMDFPGLDILNLFPGGQP